MPHFFVDDAFSDSKEVLSMPPRHRLAAVGLWTLCGAWSMSKLTDGFIPNEALDRLGGRRAIIVALCESSLWERVSGGIRFTNWAKWQRTREQVESYRAWDSERKRNRRRTISDAVTSVDSETSPRDSPRDKKSCPQGTPTTPVPVPLNTVTTHVVSESHLSNARDENDAQAATSGAEIVRRIIPNEHPNAVKTMLRIRASELINTGTPTETVEAALKLWLTKPNLGPNVLPSLVSEVIKTRASTNSHGLTAGEAKVIAWAELGNAESNQRKAIGQ